jgi:hypothetical protein
MTHPHGLTDDVAYPVIISKVDQLYRSSTGKKSI